MTKKGTVVRNTGSHYIVKPDDGGDALTCKVKGNFRIRGIRTTNPVAVGDRVEVTMAGTGDTHLITGIEPRTNYIIRRASNLSKESHIIAANIDLAALVVTLYNPETSTTFIDRFLSTAEAYSVPAALVVNKTDLLTQENGGREVLDALTHLYKAIGYTVVEVSARTGEGIEKLKELFKNKTVLLSGNSGVGKSTLLNELVPDAEARVGDVSAAHHTGMHTTTFSSMLPLPGGGQLIDTPGIRGFGTIDYDLYQVTHYFPEIFRRSEECRFGNCTHTHEPGCAVRQAVEEGRIAQSRYESYLSILEDIDRDDKYRKPQ